MTEPTHGQRIVKYPDAVWSRTILRPPGPVYGQNIFRESSERMFQRPVRDPGPLYGQEMWRALIAAGIGEGTEGHSLPSGGGETPVEEHDYLWVGYTNVTDELVVRQAEILGEPGAQTQVWTSDPIVIPFASGGITCGGSQDEDTCFVATNGAPGGTQTLKVYKVVKSTLTATEVFSAATTHSSSQIKKLWPYTDPDVYFNVYWDPFVAPVFGTELHGLWKSTNGGTSFSYLDRGHDVVANKGVHTFAKASTGPQAGRIYTCHTNLSAATGSGPEIALSYTDDEGATWIDEPGSAFNQFATGFWGFISLHPLDDGSGRVYYSVANSGAGISTSYFVPGVGVTLNGQFVGVTDSAFIEHSYYQTPNQRILIQGQAIDSSVWLSTDSGLNWNDGAFDNILTDVYDRYCLYSMLPLKDWFVITTYNLKAILISAILGQWQEITLDLPDGYFTRMVAWVGGRN